MSALLKEAFIDAKALRDVALKNAEATIVEKYSDEVRKTLDTLLEQEEGGLDHRQAGLRPQEGQEGIS